MSLRIIEVVPYNARWPVLFEDEAALLRRTLGDVVVHILQPVGRKKIAQRFSAGTTRHRDEVPSGTKEQDRPSPICRP